MQFNKTLLTAALLTVGGFASVSASAAGSDSGSFDVNLEVTEICKVNSASGVQDINFGSYAAGAEVAEASSATAISVNCSNTTSYNIGLLGSGLLTDEESGTSVEYKLLKDTGGTVWGNTGTDVGGEGKGMAPDRAQSHTVYASLEPDSTANLTAGTYTDNVTVTVTY